MFSVEPSTGDFGQIPWEITKEEKHVTVRSKKRMEVAERISAYSCQGEGVYVVHLSGMALLHCLFYGAQTQGTILLCFFYLEVPQN